MLSSGSGSGRPPVAPRCGIIAFVRTVITSDTPAERGPGTGDGARSGHDADLPATPYGRGRTSAARTSIAETADALGAAFTVDGLARAVRVQRPSTGVATVYRAVAAMVSSGFLERVGEHDGTALFARCGASGHHHHHVVCTGCGAMVVTACPIGDALTGEAAKAGFTVTGHDVRIYGLCRECSPLPSKPSPRPPSLPRARQLRLK